METRSAHRTKCSCIGAIVVLPRKPQTSLQARRNRCSKFFSACAMAMSSFAVLFAAHSFTCGEKRNDVGSAGSCGSGCTCCRGTSSQTELQSNEHLLGYQYDTKKQKKRKKKKNELVGFEPVTSELPSPPLSSDSTHLASACRRRSISGRNPSAAATAQRREARPKPNRALRRQRLVLLNPRLPWVVVRSSAVRAPCRSLDQHSARGQTRKDGTEEGGGG